MKTRQIIIVLAAVAIIVIGRFISKKLAEPKERAPRQETSNVTTVFTQKVKNKEIPIYVETTGVLKALDRTELFSEVQGVMLPDRGQFRPGNTFSKGEILLSIKADDQRAQVVAKRSSFERLVSSVMPDIKLDFPDAFEIWQNFLNSIDVNKSIGSLPEMESEQLKLFLTGRNIYTEYYGLKNQEILLSKYTIKAPFSGTLISANARPGTVIRPGQLLGTFIKPNVYELEGSFNADVASRLKIGQEVELKLDGFTEKNWTGKVSRVNNSVDPLNQTSQFFVSISSEELKDGTFMQARVKTKAAPNAFEIPRAALVDDKNVFVVKDEALSLMRVEVLHYNEQSVVVRGLEDGMQVLTKVPTGAFDGMQVAIYSENEEL